MLSSAASIRQVAVGEAALMVDSKILAKTLIGPAGEHYCLAQLLLRGCLATMGPPGIPEVDILVLSPDGITTVATIQVKTRTQGADGGWHMRKKHETSTSPRLFYAFVDFEPKIPAVYVVPSGKVADVVKESHQAWLAMPGKQGQPHNDHDMRRILPSYAHPVNAAPTGWLSDYQDRWDLITAKVSEEHGDHGPRPGD
jgi:hypothetical protein